MYRMANFFVSKNLDKAMKMPNYRQWKVSESDRSVEGPLLLYVRAKGWFFDRVCAPGIRYCVLTKRGFLLIYMHNEKGFVLDMRRAAEIKTLSDNVSVLRTKYRRCRVKIRYAFGTVNIILTNGKIDAWRDRLLNATNAPLTAAITRQLALPPVDPDYVVAQTPVRPTSSMYGPLDNVEISPSLVALKSFGYSDKEEDSKRENNNWARVKTPARQLSQESVATAVDVSTCDDDYQCLSSRLQQIEEEDDTQSASEVAETCMSGLFNYDSVRESNIPVGWLRRQLEHKITADRRRSVFVAPPTTPVAKTKEEEASTISEEPTLSKEAELRPMPLNAVLVSTTTVTAAPKSKKQVKFASRRSATKKSSRESARFNSFQFWRSSVFESDV